MQYRQENYAVPVVRVVEDRESLPATNSPEPHQHAARCPHTTF